MKPIKKILFIDDEPSLLELAPLMFDEYEVLASDAAGSILDLIKNFNPDIILLDIFMRMGGGLEICQTIKSHPEYASIPVLLMTAGTIKKEFYQYGADGIVEKPFDTPAVITQISSLIG